MAFDFVLTTNIMAAIEYYLIEDSHDILLFHLQDNKSKMIEQWRSDICLC